MQLKIESTRKKMIIKKSADSIQPTQFSGMILAKPKTVFASLTGQQTEIFFRQLDYRDLFGHLLLAIDNH